MEYYLDLVSNRWVQTVRGTSIDHGDHQVPTAAEEGDQCAG